MLQRTRTEAPGADNVFTLMVAHTLENDITFVRDQSYVHNF